MSRFYDTLREVSRIQPVPPAPEWEGAASQSEDAPPSPAEPVSRVPEPVPQIAAVPEPEPRKAAAAAAAFAPSLDLSPEQLFDQTYGPENGHASRNLGTMAAVVLNEQARLIPNSVESVSEHYRRLRTKILQQHQIKPFRILLVASSSPQEGKTVTTMNLGLSFAMIPSFKVLVIDGDMRRGSIGQWLGLGKDRAGFSDLIEGTARLEDVVLKCDSTPAHFIVRGNSTMSPPELLHSPRMGSQLRTIADYYDLVLVDSAPLSMVTDTQLLVNHCDAVLLSARAFHSTRKSLELAARELHGFRIVGTVLNGGTRPKSYYKGYYKHV